MILWQITTSGWNSKGSLAPLDGSGKRCRAECPAPPGGGGSDCRTDGAGITAGFTLLRMSFSQTAGSMYPSLCHSTIASIKSLTDNRFLSCHFFMICEKVSHLEFFTDNNICLVMFLSNRPWCYHSTSKTYVRNRIFIFSDLSNSLHGKFGSIFEEHHWPKFMISTGEFVALKDCSCLMLAYGNQRI